MRQKSVNSDSSEVIDESFHASTARRERIIRFAAVRNFKRSRDLLRVRSFIAHQTLRSVTSLGNRKCWEGWSYMCTNAYTPNTTAAVGCIESVVVALFSITCSRLLWVGVVALKLNLKVLSPLCRSSNSRVSNVILKTNVKDRWKNSKKAVNKKTSGQSLFYIAIVHSAPMFLCDFHIFITQLWFASLSAQWWIMDFPKIEQHQRTFYVSTNTSYRWSECVEGSLLGFLAYMNTKKSAATVFGYITSPVMIFNWIYIFVAYKKYDEAVKADDMVLS